MKKITGDANFGIKDIKWQLSSSSPSDPTTTEILTNLLKKPNENQQLKLTLPNNVLKKVHPMFLKWITRIL